MMDMVGVVFLLLRNGFNEESRDVKKPVDCRKCRNVAKWKKLSMEVHLPRVTCLSSYGLLYEDAAKVV